MCFQCNATINMTVNTPAKTQCCFISSNLMLYFRQMKSECCHILSISNMMIEVTVHIWQCLTRKGLLMPWFRGLLIFVMFRMVMNGSCVKEDPSSVQLVKCSCAFSLGWIGCFKVRVKDKCVTCQHQYQLCLVALTIFCFIAEQICYKVCYMLSMCQLDGWFLFSAPLPFSTYCAFRIDLFLCLVCLCVCASLCLSVCLYACLCLSVCLCKVFTYCRLYK